MTDYQTYPSVQDAVAARDALLGWPDAEVDQLYLPDHEDADGEGNVWVLRCAPERITGTAAIEYAEARGLTLRKYADPTEDARDGLSVEKAREVGREDPSLIYITTEQGEYLRTDGQVR